MTDTPRRQIIAAPTETVLSRLPAMGRIMLIAQVPGVTHERIGQVESVTRDGGHILCRGAAHDARITDAHVATIVLDRSPGSQGKILPRIAFRDDAGDTLFSVIGLDGPEPFDPGLEGLPMTDTDEAQGAIQVTARPDVAGDDAGRLPFDAARGKLVEVVLERPGYRQAWRGELPELRIGMGYINLMCPDFHMHVPGATVARWNERTEAGMTILTALNAAGDDLGLSLRAGTGAFTQG